VTVTTTVTTAAPPPPEPPPPTAPTSEATVTTWEVGGLDCKETTESTAPVSVSWTTENATAVELAVDGSPPGASPGYGPSGSAELPVPCDDQAHTLSVTALDDAGSGQTMSETITAG
jgi:hypothetical protein